MEIQNDGTYPHFVPLSTLIIANTCTPLPVQIPFKEGPHLNSWRGHTHLGRAEQSTTTWLTDDVFNMSFCFQTPPGIKELPEL